MASEAAGAAGAEAGAAASGDFPDFLAIIEQYEEDERLARRVQGEAGAVDGGESNAGDSRTVPAPAAASSAVSAIDDERSDSRVTFEVARNGRPVIDPAQLVSVLRVHGAGVREEDEDKEDGVEEEGAGCGKAAAAATVAAGAGAAAAAAAAAASSSLSLSSTKRGDQGRRGGAPLGLSAAAGLKAGAGMPSEDEVADDEWSLFHLALAEKAGMPSEEEVAETPFLRLDPDTLLHLAIFLHHDDVGALIQASRAVCGFLSRQSLLWKTFTRRAFGTSSRRPRKFKTWREAFVQRPRLRYQGLYALKQSYFIKPRTEEPLFANKDDKKRREQERKERRRRRKSGKAFFKIDNEVVYFRVLKFHADGTCQYTMCGENELESLPSLFSRDEARVREMQRKRDRDRGRRLGGKAAAGGGGGGSGGVSTPPCGASAGAGSASAAAAASSSSAFSAGVGDGGGVDEGDYSHNGRSVEWGYWNLSRGADTPAFGPRIVGGGTVLKAPADDGYEDGDSDEEENRRCIIRGRGIVHVAIPQRRTANVNTFTLRLWTTPSSGGVNLNNRMRPLSHCLVALSPASPYYGEWLSDILSCGAAGLRAAHLRLGENVGSLLDRCGIGAAAAAKRRAPPLEVDWLTDVVPIGIFEGSYRYFRDHVEPGMWYY